MLLNLPLEARLAGIVVIGLMIGGFINWGIYRLAWTPRAIGPWTRPHPQAPPRQLTDRLPLVGWLGMLRESPLHGRAFWVRPLLIELFFALGIAALYDWELRGGLLPAGVRLIFGPLAFSHGTYLAHVVLLALMTVATFIDFDEKTIPDSITIPGTLLGLFWAVVLGQSLLPSLVSAPKLMPPVTVGNLLLTSTGHWPVWLNGFGGLALGVGGMVAWCLAMIHATATLRRGWYRGALYYLESIRRHRTWPLMTLLAILSSVAIAGVWHFGGTRWETLLTAIVGMVFGGGLIWGVRIVGRIALHKEAMGFGDVTLMAMIGAHFGWQAALCIFFFSPLAALGVALAQWALSGRRDIAFGPYLCVSAVIVLVFWGTIWEEYAHEFFAMGWLIPAMVAVCLLLMLGLLSLWRIVEQWLFSEA